MKDKGVFQVDDRGAASARAQKPQSTVQVRGHEATRAAGLPRVGGWSGPGHALGGTVWEQSVEGIRHHTIKFGLDSKIKGNEHGFLERGASLPASRF